VARILVIEDSPDIAALIRHYLERAGHSVDDLGSGRDAVDRARRTSPDLVVLDLMLPGMDGWLVCQAIRQEPATGAIPIIMVTARGEEADRVRGLELGADDYVVKPFSPKELVARVAALLRRVDRPKAAARLLTHGSITVDLERHDVRVDGREIRLTAKEFLLLQYLIEHRGRVLSRDLLLTDVWGYQYTGGTRTVDVHVRRLREKIPLLATGLTTVKQFGYRLEDVPGLDLASAADQGPPRTP
jgi:DNA-binding response OmpR family regulator